MWMYWNHLEDSSVWVRTQSQSSPHSSPASPRLAVGSLSFPLALCPHHCQRRSPHRLIVWALYCIPLVPPFDFCHYETVLCLLFYRGFCVHSSHFWPCFSSWLTDLWCFVLHKYYKESFSTNSSHSYQATRFSTPVAYAWNVIRLLNNGMLHL